MQRPMALADQFCIYNQAPGPTLLAIDLLQGEVAISQEEPQLSPSAMLQLLQELPFRRKREEALVQELKSKIKTIIDLVLELNAGKKMERNLWQNLGAYRLREVEFLKDQDSRKKREEELLQDCNNLRSEREEWSRLCKSALASIKELEEEIRSKDNKHGKLETEMKARFALVAQSQAAEKSQHEKILLSKDSGIEALQFQLAEMKNEKRKKLDEKVEMNTMSKELVCNINSMQLFLIKHVAALTANVQEYQKILRIPDKPNASQELGNDHGEEARSQKTAPCIDEQENAEDQGTPSLESSAENLIKEIDCANSAMTQVVEKWKQTVSKCGEVPAKLERTSDTGMDSSFEICEELGVDVLNPHKKMKTMKDILQEDSLTGFSPAVDQRRLLDVILGKNRSTAKLSEVFKAKIVAIDFPHGHGCN